MRMVMLKPPRRGLAVWLRLRLWSRNLSPFHTQPRISGGPNVCDGVLRYSIACFPSLLFILLHIQKPGEVMPHFFFCLAIMTHRGSVSRISLNKRSLFYWSRRTRYELMPRTPLGAFLLVGTKSEFSAAAISKIRLLVGVLAPHLTAWRNIPRSPVTSPPRCPLEYLHIWAQPTRAVPQFQACTSSTASPVSTRPSSCSCFKASFAAVFRICPVIFSSFVPTT